MANPEHLKILKKGVEAWNVWRKDNPGVRPNLRHANLSHRDLRAANLSRADLASANFVHAELVGADLTNARLVEANLRRANLAGACLAGAVLFFANLTSTTLIEANLNGARFCAIDLTAADLRDADLSHAEISLVTFHNTMLDGTDLTESSLAMSLLTNVDLSTTRGLETITHRFGSDIGIDTIYRSKGKIPEPFLRGCGIPDEMIEFIRFIALNPIQFNSCFISYSTKDQEFAERLYNDLQASNVRCWFAPHDIKGGKKLHEQIDWAIHYHDRTLLILSPESINSAWVKTEIAKARKREIAEKRQVLFPIRLFDFDVLRKWEYFDADSGTDYAKEIREYFIPDFSNWKNYNSYQKAFKALLRDLRGERKKAESAK